ncbi:MAG: TM0106 family RecB-like putative nuclease [Patescibacteria group bacterium]|nr:TM0106 family RecB-like putative nuclease [Patescibacteria group bacterium]
MNSDKSEKERKKESEKAVKVTGGMFVRYFSCPHWLYFDVYGDPAERSEPTSFAEMLIERGLIHEEKIINGLEYESVGDGSLEERFERTVELMKRGVERIYHGILMDDDMVGEPDLLERSNDAASDFGEYHYSAVDIKSAERLTDSMRLQLAFYGELLERVQGIRPKECQVLNGSGARIGFQLKEVDELYPRVIGEIREILAGKKPMPRVASGCKQSPWFKKCIAFAEDGRDVTLIYNVKMKILTRLRELGIRTIDDAAEMDIDEVREQESSIKRKHLTRIQLQAKALIEKTHYFRKDINLPEAKMDIFFDIEGDPLRSFEYLFGFWVRDEYGERYVHQMAEVPGGEEKMWKEFLGWADSLPDDYAVYHFGTYEKTRLNSMEARYGGSDALERFRGRMIDLNEIVKDRVTFPLYFYGIKDIGNYIGFLRKGEIAGGGESVAWFERWLATKDRDALEEIIRYNRDDVIATRELKDWLVVESAKAKE